MDLILKELTEHPVVVDILVKGVTDRKAKYEPKSVQWDDGSRSELVLLPKRKNSESSPIIIEFQENVDDAFINQQTGIGLQAITRYDNLPYFLIICMGNIDPSLNAKKSRNSPCYDLPYAAWNVKCRIITYKAAFAHIQGVDTLDTTGHFNRICELNPFTAYAIFIHGLLEDVLRKSEDTDPTLEVLFVIIQLIRRRLYGDKAVDDPRPRKVENPINGFYERLENSINELQVTSSLDEVGEIVITDYATRKPKKMMSAKKRRDIEEGRGSKYNATNDVAFIADRVLKEFTEHPVVVDIVVKGVTNKKAKYEAKSVEWDDGTRSELVLLPKKQNNSKSLAPVIIEFQENVDDAYIKKLIGKGLQASTKYDIAPYFLIICMGKLDSALNVKKPRSTPCFELSCTTWAQKCLIMNRNSAYDHVQGVDTGDTLGYYHNRVCELNPFIAYAIFITGLTEDVLEKSEDEIDPTLDVLFTILQKVRRKLFGDEVVDKAPPSSVENPINDFYKVFEESLYTLLSSYCFDEGGEEYIAEYATRKPQKMVSAKERRRIIEEYENDMEQDDDW